MSEIIETVKINDTLRVASYFDYYAEGPFDWDLIKIQTLRQARDINPLSTDDGHRAQILELMEHNPHTGGTYASGWSTSARDDWERDAITKHLTRAGFDCHFLQLVGTSQSEWADIVIYATAGDITEWGPIAREVKAWFAGEVYELRLEELITYTAPNGNTLSQWETVESINGVYLFDELTRDTAELFFDITAAMVAA